MVNACVRCVVANHTYIELVKNWLIKTKGAGSCVGSKSPRLKAPCCKDAYLPACISFFDPSTAALSCRRMPVESNTSPLFDAEVRVHRTWP